MQSINPTYILTKDILNLEEACFFLGISKSTMYKITSEGKKLRFFKPSGKLIYFKRKDLEDFMLQNEVKPLQDSLEEKLSQIRLKNKA